MYYLSACNRGLFKSCYCYVLFLPFEKSLEYYEKYFWFQNSVLTNIRNKCVRRKINFYFFELMKNGQFFPSKVSHFQYDHIFVFSRETGNIITCKKVPLQKLPFSSFHFLQNILIETSNVCFKNFQFSYIVLCHFLISWRLEDSKHIKRYIFHYFF